MADTMKVAASTMKSGCHDANAAISPAKEKPNSSIVFSDDDMRLLAFTRNSAGTRFGRIACFAGLKSVLAVATRKTTIKTPGSHVRARNGIVTVMTARAISVRIMTRCRLKRSTRAPAINPNKTVGAAFAIRPRATTDGE